MGSIIISKKQKQIYDYIAKFINANKYAPSLLDVQHKFKLASPSTAHYHIQKLIQAGFLDKEYHRSRSLSIRYNPIPKENNVVDKPKQFLPINQIIYGDAVAELSTFPDNSIDLVVTSPPYDDIRDYHGFSLDLPGIGRELYRVLKRVELPSWSSKMPLKISVKP